MKHTIKLLTLAAILTAVFGLTGCPGPVNTVDVWDDGVVTTEPTCTEEGVKTYTCSNGETRTESIPIDPNNHNFGEWSNWTVTKVLAYNQDEEKEHTHTCTRCGHSETEKVTVSRFVAGGYDGEDAPNETSRYQYADGIKFHLYVTTQEKFDTRSSDIWDYYYLSFNASTYSELIEKYGNLFEMVEIRDDNYELQENCKIPLDKLLNLKGVNNDFIWYPQSGLMSNTPNTENDDFRLLGMDVNTDSIMEYYIVTTN